MRVQEVKSFCDRHHEKLFFWLIEYVFEVPIASFVPDALFDFDPVDGLFDVPSLLLDESVIEFCESIENVENLRELIIAVSCSSPGRFGEVFFRNRPEFTVYEDAEDEPWRFYPEQWEAIEYPGDLLICAGTGTGKTRLLACKGLFIPAFLKASVLVVTHTDNARNQIFSEMLYQISRSEFLREIFPEHCISRGNTKEIAPADPRYGTIRFCLSGDGDQVLGIQIGRGGYLILDEAARYKNIAWAKILSRARRGCRVIAGSVAYGRKGNKFEALLRRAVDLSLMKMAAVRQLESNKKRISFAKVTWNRENQPGWTEEERQMAIDFHGDPEGVEYRVYVRGEIAEQIGQVFLDRLIKSSFVDIPLYRSLKIVWDASKKIVTCTVSIVIDGILTVIKRDEFRCPGESGGPRGLEELNISQWVIRNSPAVPVDVGGLDSGKIQDPSVLLAFEDTGVGLRCRWSLVTLYLPYPLLTELIAGLYKYEKRNIFNLGIGIEAAGHNIASAIWEGCKILGVPESWLSPFSWQTKVTLTQEDRGKKKRAAVRDENRHEVKRSLKHHLTQRMIDLMYKQTEGIRGSWEMPCGDEPMRTEFSEHAGEYQHGDFRYDEIDDHFIEAARVALGRLLLFRGGVEFTRASQETIERLTLPWSERKINRDKLRHRRTRRGIELAA